MKKVLTLIFFVFFVTSAIAQDVTKSFQELAKKDLAKLKTIISVPASQNETLYDFFYKKYKLYAQFQITAARKVVVKSELEAELKSYFTSVDLQKLDRNKKIFNELISE